MSPRPTRALSPSLPLLVGLALGLAALVTRYIWILHAPYSYDEATYVELARHPFQSSYYPEPFFARHPPLAFLLLSAWSAHLGDAEWAMRLPGLLVSAVALGVVVRTVRRHANDAWAGAVAVALGASILVLGYGVQATLYPFAFLLAALAVAAHLNGRVRAAHAFLAAMALTHLFGMILLAATAWSQRRAWRQHWVTWSLPGAWLVGSTAAALALRHRPGPELGPAWQATRIFEWVYQLWAEDGALARHALLVAILALALFPLLWARVLKSARARDPLAIGALVLSLFLVTGPAFLRFGLLLAPVVLGLAVREGELPPRRGRRTVAIALAGLLLGGVALTSGIDARLQNDVPGFQDWRAVAGAANAWGALTVAGAAPTSMAFYLEAEAGYRVVSSQDGPDLLPLQRPHGPRIDVRILRGPADVGPWALHAAVLAVPSRDLALAAKLPGHVACQSVPGLHLLVSADLAATACPGSS